MSSEDEVVLGPYELRSTLGRGASAIVYRAYDVESRREVALKIASLPPEAALSRTRFVRAAELWATVRSPHVVKVFEYGEFPKWGPYLAMEYVRGQDLEHLMREGAFEVERAAALIRQVILALREAHRKGVLHRDIKPGNIIVTEGRSGEELVKVTDFGIAKQTDDAQSLGPDLSGQLTGHGQLLGTPRYMAPEQVDAHAVSQATDLYSAGLVFYELLTGKVAVPGKTIQALLLRQLDADPIIDPLDPDVPEAFRDVLARATAKEISKRYETAEQFLVGLDAAVVRWKREGDVAAMTAGLPSAPRGLGRKERDARTFQPTEPKPTGPTDREEPRTPQGDGFVAGVVSAAGRRGQEVTRTEPLYRQKPRKSPKERMAAALKVTTGLFVGLLLLVGGLWFGQGYLLFRPPELEPNIITDMERRGWVQRGITSSIDTRLVGYYGAARKQGIVGTVLVIHDLHTSPERQALRLQHLRDSGLNVMVIAQRGYGGSEGETTDFDGLVADSVRAFDMMTVMARSGGKRLYVYGHGLGGAVAVEVTLQRPVSGLILEGAPVSLAARVDELVFGLPAHVLLRHRFDTAQALRQTRAPVLLLHGEEDGFIPAEHSRRLYTVGKTFKSLRVVPGAEHDNLIGQMGAAAHAQALRAFMETASRGSDQTNDRGRGRR